MKPGPWDIIKAEYLAGRDTLQNLSKKYGVSVSAARSRSKVEGWKKERLEMKTRIKDKVVAEVSEIIVKGLAEQMSYMAKASGRIMQRLLHAEKQVNLEDLAKKITSVDEYVKLSLAIQRINDIWRGALGAEDSQKLDEGMTPTNLARQEAMIADIKMIHLLATEGKTKDFVPNLEMMKRAVIVDDGS